MKQDVSEHLAKAFLDNRVRKSKELDRSFGFYVAVSIAAVTVLILLATLFLGPKSKGFFRANEAILLEKHDGPYLMNFDFHNSDSKVVTLSIDIPDIDLSGYKSVRFSARIQNADANHMGNVKVTLVNRRKESASLYLSQIENKWNDISLRVSEFDKIRDWSRLSHLMFTLEEWNVFPKKGELLIEGIQFSKSE